MKKQLLAALLAALLLLSLTACAKTHQTTSDTVDADVTVPSLETSPAGEAPADGEAAEDAPAAAPVVVNMDEILAEIDSKSVSDFSVADEMTDYVKISITGYGDVVIRLRPDIAPISAANFQTLVGQGFYDGLSFHRVYPGFMIQGGDPEGTGMGGSDQTIRGEFASNGIENNLSHVRGVLSMARAQDPDSASSQFFLMHADSDFLDGNYAAFGYVVAGLDTIDKVCQVELTTNAYGEQSVPVTPVIMESAVFVTPN